MQRACFQLAAALVAGAPFAPYIEPLCDERGVDKLDWWAWLQRLSALGDSVRLTPWTVVDGKSKSHSSLSIPVTTECLSPQTDCSRNFRVGLHDNNQLLYFYQTDRTFVHLAYSSSSLGFVREGQWSPEVWIPPCWWNGIAGCHPLSAVWPPLHFSWGAFYHAGDNQPGRLWPHPCRPDKGNVRCVSTGLE